MGQGSRVLVLGLDGACWELIDRFVEEGRLPNIAALLTSGFRAPLNSTTPPMTLPSWSSMLTGTNPGKHGIFDFVHRSLPGWDLEYGNSTHREVPTLHRLLSDRGARVASLCVPTTWPPESLNGVVISGFDSPVSTGISASHCHPREIFGELSNRFGGLHFADFNECRIDARWHANAREALLREVPRKEAVARWLLSGERWDLMMLLWGEIDTACHHFWRFCDPESPRYRSDIGEGLRDTIAEVYTAIDASIGRLLDAADPDLICICSDHGFGGASDYVLHLNRYLQSHGWLSFSDSMRSRPMEFIDGARMAAARTMPHSLQGPLFRALPDNLLNRSETSARFGRLAIDQSRAFSDEMNYAATIRLNLPVMKHRAAVQELQECLGDWRVDGHSVVKSVHYRDDLYWGDAVYRSPEIVLELDLREGYSYTLLSSNGDGPDWKKLGSEELQGAKGVGMNGSHRQQGILIWQGKGVPQGRHSMCQMWDIAPTILAHMDVEIPAYMDGVVLWGEGFRSSESNFYPESRPTLLGRREVGAMRARLGRLGYL